LYDHTGRRIRKKVNGSKEMAKKAEARLRVKIDEREFLGVFDAKKIRFREFSEEYLRYLEVNAAKETNRRYTYAVNTMVELSGELYLQDITTKMIEDFKTRRATQGKPNSVNKDLTVIKSMFSRAVRWGYVKESPAQGVDIIRRIDGSARYLSQEEAKNLMQTCKASASPRLYEIVVMALHTGMRLGEILHVQWRDIDFSRGVVAVVSREEHPTKNRKSRQIPLSQFLSESLRQIPRRLNSPYVFPNDDGTPRRVDTVSRAFTNVVKQAGLDHITFHGLRHTFASWAAMAGVEIPTIGKLVGHGNIVTTMRYAHLSPEHLSGAIHFLDRHNLGTSPSDERQAVA
jgi:integrase